MTNALCHRICLHFPCYLLSFCPLTWPRGAQYPEAGFGILGHIGAIVEGIEIRSPIVVDIGQFLLRKEPLRTGQGGDNDCHRNAAKE